MALLIERHNGHYLLENNLNPLQKESSAAAAFATTTKTATMKDWHQFSGTLLMTQSSTSRILLRERY